MGDRFGRRVAATTVALVVVGTATLLAVRSFGPARTSRPRVSEQAPDAADPWEGLRAGWTELPPPPEIREGATLVWTGRGLIAWGGTAPRDDSYAPTADGYAFDPTSRTWSAIPAGPVARIDASSVWTGTEVLIWGGTQKELRVDGAAFDPSTDSWRPIPAAPIEPRYPAAVVWTGRELLVWGGGPDRKETFVDGAAYDPASDTWRRIADSPIKLNLADGVWSGREMLVFGSLLDNRNRASTDTSVGAAYDPADDTWRRLPRSDLSPQATSAGWVGDRMVAWDYQVHAQEYSPGDNTWSAPQKMPLSASECYPDSAVVGRLLFAWFCGDIALYDAATGGWRRVRGGVTKPTVEANGNSYRLYRFAALASAGDVLALEAEGITVNKKGVPCYGCPGSPVSFWAYRPPAAPSSTVENGLIAFSRGGSESGIYVMNADGTGVERLTSDPGDGEPAWSPDGSRIAFVRFQGGKSDIYVMNADGSEVTRLTTDGANSVPAWSPDGTRIAFARDIPGNQDIYVMDPDGSNVARLTDDPLLEYAPAWSPDGTRIAFSAYASPPGPVHIYSMNADGTSRVQITDSQLDDASPAWSPDGASVAFVRDSSSIFVVGPDGSGLREVVDPRGLTGGLGLTFSPTWSPDGAEIAFPSGPDGSDQRIYVVNVDGSGLHEVGTGKGSDPTWQPVPVGSSPRPTSSPTATPALATTEHGTPFDVAFGDGAVWALTCDSGCSGDRRDSTGSALRIDPASGEVLASVSLRNPSKIAVGEGGVWVISFWDGTLTRIDPVTSQIVATIQLQLPFSVCETCPDPRDFLPYDLAVREGAVWLDTARGVLARIDPATNEVAAMIRVPGDSTGELAVGNGAVWVTETVLGLYRVDPATNEITAQITMDDDGGRRLSVDQVVVGGDAVFAQGAWARKTTSLGHDEYVLVRGAAITRIDPAAGQSTALYPVGDHPRLTAFDSGALWLWEFHGTSLERIDPESGGVTATVEAPAAGYFVGVGEGAGWVAMPGGSIRRVNLPTG